MPNSEACANHGTVLDSWNQIQTLYQQRNLLENLPVIDDYTDIKTLMETCADYGGMRGALQNHINHYGNAAFFDHEVRCNEIGETAHCIMSFLCWEIRSPGVYGKPVLRNPKDTDPITPGLRRVQANAILSCGGENHRLGVLANATVNDMKSYNRGGTERHHTSRCPKKNDPLYKRETSGSG